MKFGIVIPLKSKRISRDWSVTCAALEGTLNSIQNQTDKNFVVAIAGHDCPDFLRETTDERFVFTKVDYPAPDRSAPGFTNKELINDKVLKIMTGLIALKDEPLSWIYQIDSDDLMRNDFIEKIHQQPESSAIIIQGGYLLYQSSQRTMETEEMDELCGSIAVVKPESFEIPDSADLKYIHDIPWTKYRHMNIHKFFSAKDLKVIKTKEKLVTYLLATGDNFSDRWRIGFISNLKAQLKPYIFGKKLSKNFKHQFSIK